MASAIKLLLVDDDDVDRMAVRRALDESNLNFEVTEAVDGAEALAAYDSNPYDCVILDYNLPDSTGAGVFTDMLKNTTGSAAVIFLTGKEDEALALKMMGIGAVDYLTKSELSTSVLERAIKYASARQRYLAQLAAVGQIDTLTGLLNRSVLDDVLNKAIAQAKRANNIVAVALLDLDHFKDINDSLGHPAGDELLKVVADRLTAVTRETDSVLRLGGDEFVVVAANLTELDGAAQLARKIIGALAEPVQLELQPLFVSTSIGISLAPTDAKDPAELLKNADLALYRAKAEGRGRYHFYNEDMHTVAVNRRQLDTDLRKAIARDELALYYQPKVHAESGAILGAEALIRWHHPERGTVLPGDFISIAETSQIIVEIGEWVLRTASAQVMTWQKDGIALPNCSINLSPLQLKSASLAGAFIDVIEETGIDPKILEIEITESTIMDNVETVATILGLLRRQGISVSIDDFGTGYSSLEILKQLPVDKLKIDRSFVAGITTDTNDAVIASAIISLAQNLGLEVIAEGVETREQLEFLQQNGCDQVQGYFFSRPLPADEFTKWFRQHHPQQMLAS